MRGFFGVFLALLVTVLVLGLAGYAAGAIGIAFGIAILLAAAIRFGSYFGALPQLPGPVRQIVNLVIGGGIAGILIVWLAFAVVHRASGFGSRPQSPQQQAQGVPAPQPVAYQPPLVVSGYRHCQDEEEVNLIDYSSAAVALRKGCYAARVVVPRQFKTRIEDPANGEFFYKFANEDGEVPATMNHDSDKPLKSLGVRGAVWAQTENGAVPAIEFELRGSEDGQKIMLAVERPQ